MRLTHVAAVVMSALAGVAIAKLPPLSPEQQEAAAAKKQTEQAQLEKEKESLDRVQNRVVEYYKKTTGGAGPATPTRRTEDTNISKKAVEGPGATAPQGGTKQSAEAHSTPAK
ncbi:MAG: Tat pathway signal sequence [Betaproteobacteria bacterium]|nr:Tat pathway signal sequence [Betaproteobacteria bacterium]